MFEYLKQGQSKLSPVDFLPSSSKFFSLKVFVLFDLLFYGPSTLFKSLELWVRVGLCGRFFSRLFLFSFPSLGDGPI